MKRTPLRTFRYLLLPVFSLSLAYAQVGTFTKAQVSDRIRKVEDGVDEFQKYLENRGENAALKSAVGTEQWDHNTSSSRKFLECSRSARSGETNEG